MNHFICINNAKRVWDFEEWKKAGFPHPYWRFDPDDFNRARPGDRVILYVTSSIPYLQGAHFWGTISTKASRGVPSQYWIGGGPGGSIDLVEFSINAHAKSRVSVSALNKLHPSFSKMMMGCQGRSSRQVDNGYGAAIIHAI